ncbi:MAG TPA: HD domain-containing protein [Chitinophagales bacterium]|nr:HD domain-containing protein [Chitinophagales bacterium]
MDKMQAQQIAGEVIDLYKNKAGANYSGEAITQLEHACQAAQLAEADGQSNEVILAAFLHDIGHLLDDEPEIEDMGEFGVMDHEVLGAGYLLQRGFSQTIATLVKAHVEAKRYLCAVNKRYYDNLSTASKATLQYQGGPMSKEEVAAFERNPLRNLIIKMRTWDEEAKHPNVPMPDLTIFEAKIEEHLLSQS